MEAHRGTMSSYSSSSSSSALTMTTALNFADVQVDKGVFSLTNTVHPHPGNRLFSRMVQKNREVFQTINDIKHKKLLVLSMIMAVHKNGGRFVQKSDVGEWIVLSNKEAFGLIIQALKSEKQPLRPSILMNRKRSSIFNPAAKTNSNNADENNKKVTLSC